MRLYEISLEEVTEIEPSRFVMITQDDKLYDQLQERWANHASDAVMWDTIDSYSIYTTTSDDYIDYWILDNDVPIGWLSMFSYKFSKITVSKPLFNVSSVYMVPEVRRKHIILKLYDRILDNVSLIATTQTRSGKELWRRMIDKYTMKSWKHKSSFNIMPWKRKLSFEYVSQKVTTRNFDKLYKEPDSFLTIEKV